MQADKTEGKSECAAKEDKYKRLKKRYSLLLQQHLKTNSEYRQALQEVNELRAKKKYMQLKLAEIIKRIGSEPEEFGLDLRLGEEE